MSVEHIRFFGQTFFLSIHPMAIEQTDEENLFPFTLASSFGSGDGRGEGGTHRKVV